MAIIYQPSGRAREYAPWAANLYSGCGHSCKYCYAPSALRRNKEQFHSCPKPRKDILKLLARDCKKLQGQDLRILLSFTTDPYQPIEEEYQITRQAIQILHDFGLSVEILTKGGTRAVRDFDLLTSKDIFASTLTFLDERKSINWEPGASLPEDRIKAIKQAHEMGIRTWVSLEPVVEPDESLEIIRRTHQFVDLYKVGTLNYNKLAGTIDWKKFGLEAIELLEKLNKNYYIKDDLRRFIETD